MWENLKFEFGYRSPEKDNQEIYVGEIMQSQNLKGEK